MSLTLLSFPFACPSLSLSPGWLGGRFDLVLWYQGSEKNVEAFKWEIKGNFNRKLLMCFGQGVLLGRILFPSVSCMVFFGGKGQELFN